MPESTRKRPGNGLPPSSRRSVRPSPAIPKSGWSSIDGGQLLPTQNVVDELIEVARLQSADVMVVRRRMDLLEKRGGVAAVTLPVRGALGEGLSGEVAQSVTSA